MINLWNFPGMLQRVVRLQTYPTQVRLLVEIQAWPIALLRAYFAVLL